MTTMDFVIWALAFELYLSLASLRHSAGLQAHKHKGQMLTKRIVRILTTESAAGGRLTYEKDLLNSEKNSRFYKTNHSGFPASVRQPSSLVKTNGKPTKRIVCTLTTKSAGGNHPTYEKELFNSRKNTHFRKTNHSGFRHALPPYDPNNNIFCTYAHSEAKPPTTIDLFTSTAITS